MSIMEIALIILALYSVLWGLSNRKVQAFIAFELTPATVSLLAIVDILIRHGILNVG